MYKLPHKLPNDLIIAAGGALVLTQEKKRLRILRIYEISRKYLKCVELMASTQPSTQKPNFDVVR